MSSPVALITGSSKKRVGRAVAEDLAKRGYAIALHYHTSRAEGEKLVGELRGRGVSAECFRADLRNEGDVRRMVEGVFERFGRVDVLVNAAAIWNPKPLEEVTATDVREHFETNTLGTFLCAQQVGLRMVMQKEGGCIINIGDWAIERPYLNYGAYFPSKGAIPTLTRSLAVELGTRNPKVRVNCILPGPVMLPEEMSAAEKEKVIAQTLVKREGSPEHVAHAVRFLIENEFVTGISLPVDGGRTIYAPEG
ncbi:MAG: SDR family oxidoreductase [Planctomycetales bacterium]